MRLDVREKLERAAADELAANGSYVVLVSREVAEALVEQSAPVRIQLVTREDSAIADMVVESVAL